ncbi:hypothetical protein VTO42DRAFT_908 [Malbranchea cinnamomea]
MHLRSERRVSLGRTQFIIDQCLTAFLRCQLEDPERRRDATPATHLHSPSGDTIQGQDYDRGNFSPAKPESTTLRPVPGIEIATINTDDKPADPEVLSIEDGKRLRYRPDSRITFGHCQEKVPKRLFTPETTSHTTSFATNERVVRTAGDRHTMIFAPLEHYIVTHFDGCDSLNNSFLTVKPRHQRTASEGGQPVSGTESEPTPSALLDVPISQLDEKTLRLGDIVENGSWWTGERPARHKSTDDRQSRTEAGGGLVSLKTPRINWSELAEWYRSILHAGESWLDIWAGMRPTESEDPESAARLQRYESTKLALINQQIYDSRLHLRMTLLKASERLLQRPKRPLNRPEDIRFILILLENPLLYPSHGMSKHVMAPSLPVSRSVSRSRNAEAPMAYGGATPSPTRPLTLTVPANELEDYRRHIIKRAMGILSNLPSECHHVLVSWLSRFSESHFRRLVQLAGSFVSYRLTRQRKKRIRAPKSGDSNIDEFVPTFSSSGNPTPAQLHSALHREKSAKNSNTQTKALPYEEDWQIKAAARVMALLFRANFIHHSQQPNHSSKAVCRAHAPLIPISSFYSTILDYSDIIADFEAWESRSSKFSFCQYSFFLSIWAKIRILEHDARRQMEAKAREAFFDSILGKRGVSQYLVLKVRRECLVEDSLRRVSEVVGSGEEEIKKGLRIEFDGEEGVDAGGLRKEWFLMLTREIFNPLHGLFLYDEDSQYCYFNPHCFESSEQFFLVGVLLGLAIYNSTILDIALPPFAFRKLLASPPSNSNPPSLSTPLQPFRCTLDDLAEYRPALAKGLRQLLEYEGDVEETFCQTFVVQQDRYGEIVEIPLCAGGETRPVTNSNRREFVDLYVKYVLNEAVARQFEPFKRGFFTVCGGNALYLFRPEEIELLVRGSEEPLDIPSLRAVAVYEHWPMSPPDQEPVVNWFWEFFASLVPKDQRKMLAFITGSDRIPAMGATNLVIRLVCLGYDSERFPTARTCFNMVGLYRYRTREKLESKLWRAVCESEGFGLK